MSATDPVQCPTSGCPGDGRYAAPGRGHTEGCRYPVSDPVQAVAEAIWATMPDADPGCHVNEETRTIDASNIDMQMVGQAVVEAVAPQLVAERDALAARLAAVEAVVERMNLTEWRMTYTSHWHDALRAALATGRTRL